MRTIHATVVTAPPNSRIEQLMRRDAADPDRKAWGDRLLAWRRSLRAFRGGAPAAEWDAFKRELRAYRRSSCVASSRRNHAICLS